MADYIEREALLKEIEQQKRSSKNSFPRQHFVVGDVMTCIRTFPAAEVAEVRHGRWNPEIHHTYIPVEYDQNGDPILHEYTSFRCSLCGREEPKEEPYCHCGARMGKEADHEVSE